MALPSSESESLSVVIVGNFNPVIFQPSWFALQELLKRSECEEAKTKIIHPDVTALEIGGWLELQVTRERFVASTSQEAYHETLRDLVIGTFRLLSHTPITTFGINLSSHHRLYDEEQIDRVFDAFVKKNAINSILKNPKIQDINLSEQKENDSGSINIVIQPSIKVKPYGLFINVNNEFKFKDKPSESGKIFLDLMKENWTRSIEICNDKTSLILKYK